MGEDISSHIWIGVIITIIPATILVAARFVAQTYGPRPPGLRLDDWLILASLVVNWIMAAIRFYQVCELGYGHHANELSVSTVSDFQKSFLAVQEAYFLNAVLTKSSLLFLYWRIFGVSTRFRAALGVAGFFVISYFVICVTISIFGCQPVSYFWDKHQPGSGHCIQEVQFFRFNGITNMLLDVMVLLLPIPMVWKLNLERQQKIAVTGMFLLGLFVCIISLLRIVAFEDSHQGDPTYTTIDTAMYSSIEQSVGIMCTCLPTLRPLVRLARHGERQGSSARRSTLVARDSMVKSARGLTFSMATGPSDQYMLEPLREDQSMRDSSHSGGETVSGGSVARCYSDAGPRKDPARGRDSTYVV